MTERFFSDEYIRKTGIIKSIMYLDGKGNALKSEQLYADDFTKKRKVSKSIMYFGSNGKVVITELYDKNGKLFE